MLKSTIRDALNRLNEDDLYKLVSYLALVRGIYILSSRTLVEALNSHLDDKQFRSIVEDLTRNN